MLSLQGRFIHSQTGLIDNIGNPFLNSLLVFYNMNESSGTRVDAVGSGHDLNEIQGTVSADTGIISNAISISGNAAIGRLNGPGPLTTANLGTANGFTITAWVFPTSLLVARTFMALHQDSDPASQGSATFSFLLQTNSSDATKVRFIVSNISGGTIQLDSATATMTENAWNFVGGWYDPVADLAHVQVNLGAIADGVYTGGIAVSATHNLTYSKNSILDLGVGNQWVGKIDASGVWGRQLTASERATLYNSGAGKEHPFN